MSVAVLVATSAMVNVLVSGPESGAGSSRGSAAEISGAESAGAEIGRTPPVADSTGPTMFQSVETPCFSFDGPADYLNAAAADDAALCLTDLELWGERDASGRILKTGFGSILGSVEVSSALVTFSSDLAPDGTLDSAVDALNVEHIPTLGTVTSLKHSATLDGMPANITRVTSHVATTRTKIMIASYAPQLYQTDAGMVRLFLIYLVIPEDNGEEILASVLDTWRWKAQ